MPAAYTQQKLTQVAPKQSFCEPVLKSLIWASTCVPGFVYVPWLAWLVKKANYRFANQVEGKLEHTSSNLSSLLGV